MRLSVTRDAALPVLAWCAVIHRDDELVEVRAGRQVEATDSCVVEGAWSGDFEGFEFVDADIELR